MSDLQKFVEKVLIEHQLGDEDLQLISEYIVVMITNQKNAEQVTSEMCDLIGDRYNATITQQIFNEINKEQSTEKPVNEIEQPKEEKPAPVEQPVQAESQQPDQTEVPQQVETSQPMAAPSTSTKRSAADASLDDLIFGNNQANQGNNYRQNKRRPQENNNQTRHPRLDPATYKLSKELTTNFLESNPQMKKQYEAYNFQDRTNFERQLLQQHFMTMQTAKVMQEQFEKMQKEAEEKAAQRLGGGVSTRGSPARGGFRGRGGAPRGGFSQRGNARGGFANKVSMLSILLTF
ncbi:hypothetical protein WALSEDRAFT_31614 [Wallemia mellicola CBS 633.66]|uniref:Uncharacterized protein n=1 Tax=Wallemia mellicola (strain ATCC MYA-4683 / CBS 633.66) TaxID=671144 RepID=I4YG42_WALMC|nr:hypothetical protein WALSEDRAFT_31614 [Wallemia mellicola CBS 633.66]EIM22934.1 hypothetical protein WALSEDRAFT_31614 [Wallemia mellicola CBS 633.66]|eukprot:XP_006956979.1 hypothetical protein WALSEDRAFT_31614 [Wallemia mellicola CBS 633.66]